MIAIKIFFKHLYTSIKKRPMQPLLLVLVVAVAMVVCILAMQLDVLLADEEDGVFYAKNGNANIVITAGSTSQKRFIDPEKAQELIGENGVVCGIYGLPFYNMSGDKMLVSGVLADVEKIGDIFSELKFVSVPTGASGLRKCIYVTKEFADANNLSKDSKVELQLFGKTKTFKVQDILENDIMGTYSIMVDTSAVVQMMAGSVWDDVLIPYGKLYIRYNNANVGKAISKLQDLYPDNSIERLKTNTGSMRTDMDRILNIFVILTVLLAVANIFCCFSILTDQRKEENALFYAVGSKPYMLNTISIVEMGVYWLIGALLGTALAVPVLKAVGIVADFKYTTPTLQYDAAVDSAHLMLAATEFSMLLFIAIDRVKKIVARRKKPTTETNSKSKAKDYAIYTIGIALFAATVVILVVDVCLPQGRRSNLAIAGIVVYLVMLFFNGRLVFKQLSVKFSDIMKLPVPVRYAIKNSGRVESQSNVASLFSVVVTICVVMLLLSRFCSGLSATYTGMINAEYIVANANAATIEKIKEIDGVENVYNALSLTNVSCCIYDKEYKGRYSEIPTDGSYDMSRPARNINSYYGFTVLAASDVDAFTDDFEIDELPGPKQIYLAETCMKTYDVEIHDCVRMHLGGTYYEDIEIVGTFRANDNIFIVNLDSLEGASYNYAAVKGEDGIDSVELYNRIFDTCGQDNIIITTSAELMKDEIRNLNVYSACIDIVVVSVVIFSAIGLLDSIASGYRSRRDEFDCYAGAGMNKKSLRIMKVSETAYSFIVGILYAAALFGLVFGLVFECMLGYDANLLFSL